MSIEMFDQEMTPEALGIGSHRVVGGVDLTPTWKAAMPILIAALQDGTPTGKRLAREELMDLADRLDRLNIEPKKEAA